MSDVQTASAAVDAVIAGAVAGQLENEFLDFKTDGRSADDTVRNLAEAAACFANARGGVLVVGVRDYAAGPGAIVGTALNPQLTQRRIFELTEPSLVVSCDPIVRQGRELLVISVPISPDLHAVAGRVAERVGNTCQRMSATRIASVVADRRGDDWSAADSGVLTSRADGEAMGLLERTFRDAQAGRVAPTTRVTGVQLLSTLGVITSVGSLTNAGALLVVPDWREAEELVYTFRRTPAGSLAANEHLAGPLISSIRRVFDLLEARSDRTSVNLPGGQQLQIADLPEAAVRESIINAVMHRDYRARAPISVEHSPGRLVVTSPGPFVSGVSADNVLTTPSRTRNATLAYAIRQLGLAEAAGTGVDRMYAEMGRVGHRPPVFAADFGRVSVTLLGGSPNATVARFVATLPPEESNDADTMLVILTLMSRPTLDAARLAPLIQKPVEDAALVLQRLGSGAAGLVEPTRSTARTRNPTYRFREHVIAALGSSMTYRRRSADSYDRTLIGVIRETGELNARLVRLTLGVGGPAASRILADLVSRGILTKTSEAARGPSVTYGPGSAFPRLASRARTTAGRRVGRTH